MDKVERKRIPSNCSHRIVELLCRFDRPFRCDGLRKWNVKILYGIFQLRFQFWCTFRFMRHVPASIYNNLISIFQCKERKRYEIVDSSRERSICISFHFYCINLVDWSFITCQQHLMRTHNTLPMRCKRCQWQNNKRQHLFYNLIFVAMRCVSIDFHWIYDVFASQIKISVHVTQTWMPSSCQRVRESERCRCEMLALTKYPIVGLVWLFLSFVVRSWPMCLFLKFIVIIIVIVIICCSYSSLHDHFNAHSNDQTIQMDAWQRLQHWPHLSHSTSFHLMYTMMIRSHAWSSNNLLIEKKKAQEMFCHRHITNVKRLFVVCFSLIPFRWLQSCNLFIFVLLISSRVLVSSLMRFILLLSLWIFNSIAFPVINLFIKWFNRL